MVSRVGDAISVSPPLTDVAIRVAQTWSHESNVPATPRLLHAVQERRSTDQRVANVGNFTRCEWAVCDFG